MSKFDSRGLKVLLLLFLASKSFAQTNDTSTVQSKPAPVIKIIDDRLFNGIRVGIDVAGIAYGYMVNDEDFKVKNRFEINGDFGIKKWFATLDLGTGTFERTFSDNNPSNSQYKSSGQYVRVGADYRISKSAKSFLFFGGRLAKGFISEKATVEIPVTPGRPSLPATELINRNLSPTWFEVATGVKVSIWNNFYMGYTLRFKLLIPSKKVKEEEPLDIPGFGVANKNNNMGLSFHLMYRIPFGKDPIIPLKGR